MSLDDDIYTIERLINKYRRSVKDLEEHLVKLRAQLEIPCAKCGQSNSISDLIYVQEKQYVSPYGCTGGDYWTSSDRSEFMCPDCGVHNKLRFDSETNLPYNERRIIDYRPDIQFKRIYQDLFRKIEQVDENQRRGYFGGHNYKWIYNDYVNRNKHKFGLTTKNDKNLVSK